MHSKTLCPSLSLSPTPLLGYIHFDGPSECESLQRENEKRFSDILLRHFVYLTLGLKQADFQTETADVVTQRHSRERFHTQSKATHRENAHSQTPPTSAFKRMLGTARFLL